MKSLSYWALLNMRKAIGILVVVHLLLATLAYYLGILFSAQELVLPLWLIYICIALFFVAEIAYPVRRSRFKWLRWSYARQKTMDFTIIGTYALAMVVIGNQSANQLERTSLPESHSSFVVPTVHKPNADDTLSKSEKRKERRQLKKELRKKVKTYVKQLKRKAKNDNNTGGKVALIIILMIVGILLVGLLSCFVACSDAPWLGLILFLSLSVLIGIGCVKWIKSVKAKGKSGG